MSSPSSRSRIDQFFTSRKKRPSSAKDTTPDKASRSTPEVSPSAKGTLDGFLVKPAAAAGPVKRNLTAEIGLAPTARKPDSHLVNNAVSADPVGIEVREPPSGPSGGNTELRRFASDFLSLYCSDLPSAEIIPAEQELKGQKRNVSPSLVVAHSKACVKKQCIVEQSDSMMGAESTSCSKDCSEPMEPDTIQPMELVESKACMGLRRCTVTPTSGLLKSGIGVPRCGIGTPKSSSRNSLFSPGEEFWNEAIQVADGLFDVVDKLPEGLPFLKSGQASNKLLNDKISYHCLDQKTKAIDKTLSAVESNKESLLPVKHFDFSHEECNGNTEISSLQRIMEKSEAVRNTGIGLADSSSVNKKCMQTSNVLVRCQAQSSSQNLSKKMDSSINEPVDMKVDSISDKQLNKNLPSLLDEKSSQTVELLSGLAVTDTNACVVTKRDVLTHIQKDKDLSVPSHNPENVEKGIKNNPSPSGNFDEAGTTSSSMQLKVRLQLSSWLPPEVCNMYTKKGISKLYPWQVDCLLVEGVLEKRNLVYCASTSAGKSFVAEVLMLRRIISTGKMALLVLPYVSICAEKAEHLEALLEPLGKHVRSFYGNQGGGSLPKDTSVAVCTIEKANSLINRLLEEGRLSEVGIIVIDELHMVGDQHRGYLLELMLTKLRYAAGEGNSESSSGESSGTSSGKTDPAHGLQMVGMSATMPNIASVADWLQAALYQTDFRPVPLEEYIKIGNTIFDKKLDVVRTLPRTADLGGKDPDHIVELCNEVVQEGHSVLLFCSSRKGCESTAKHVSKFLKKMFISLREAASEFNDASSAIEALRRCPAGLDPILEETLPSGVAYHHAGLTVEEREIIETCYRKGIVRVLTATSTLAAGVNLPARRVIFRQPRIGRDFIDGTRYKQMSGRAGRTGIDTKGESILVCKPDEARRITSILNDSCPSLQSCLSEDKNGMTHAILEVIAGGIVQTASDIHRYVRCTLLNSTKPFQDVVKSAQDSLRWLCHKKFLEWNEETKLYSTTALGRAAFGSSLTPEESLVVLDDLSRAREGFILASDLHIVYLVTPINVEVEPDWELYYERFMQLSALDQSVGNRVGVLEPFLMRMAHGAPVPTRDKSRGKNSASHDKLQMRNASDENEQILRVSKRFYVALMLSRLVQEIPVADVCEAFKVARGMIQALQENAGRFASMVSQFCERLGWCDMEGLVSKFQNRVSFGVRAEIAELTTIQYVKGSRARALYKAGLRTPAAIAEASIPEIAKALFDASAWAGQEGGAMRRMQMGIAKKIKNGARKIIFEQAEEARLVAFSAFKSLGVNVTNLSRPIVSANPEDSFTRGGSLASSREDAHSGNTRCEKASQLSSSPPVGDKNMHCDDIPQDFEKPSQTATGHVDCVGEERTMMDTEMVVEASSAFCDPPGNLPNNDVAGTSRECNIPELTASYTNAVRGERLVPGGNTPNTGIFNSSDKGPINASSIPGGFDSFLNQWDAVSEFYFDVHFSKRSDLNSPILFEVFGLAVCWEHSPVYYVNISKDLFASGKFICDDATRSSASELTPSPALSDMWEVAKSRWDRITTIIARKGVRKFTWNLKIQIQVLKVPCISVQRFGRLSVEQKEQSGFEFIDNSYIMLPSIFVHDGIDMCLVAWILWPDEESKTTPSLEKVVKKRLSSVDAAAANRDGRWRNQMHRAAHNGCCRRAAQTRALGFVFWKLLVSEDLVEALTGIENPLVQVLADMELWGIGVDMEACLHARHILVGKLKELEKEAYGLAGMTFSLFTAADIANVLYTHLKLPVPQSCKKGKLHPSTDKHSLDLLRGQHPIISVIKEHRTLAKLLNSTLGSICSRAQLCIKSQKYIIRGHWLQTSTATGRLSMEEPNLQCVEHSVLFTTCDKKNSESSDLDHHEINARDLFIPTQDNWLLLTADYSQIELRLMAHFSKDSSLIELLSKPDGDVFTMLAARWMHKTETTVSSQEREQTKRLVYGILYGMGSNSLAEQLECSSDEAAEKIQSFKTSFPGVSSWLNEAVVSCRHKGYIKTLMGRKRYLSNIKFGNNKEKAKAQRQAVNSICQGSAADIIKMAMLNLYSMIGERNVGPSTKVGHATKYSMLKGRCRILLQVHDELVLEVDSHLKREAGMLLQTSMENAVSLLVPLHVKMKIGRTWGSLDPFQLDP